MVDPGTAVTFVLAAVASAFMAWAIGAGSSGSTPFAPAVGANAISVMRAGFFVGILGLAGAVLQGQNVTEAVGRELIQDMVLSPVAATIALLLAASLVAVGVFAGYPIATAFTVTGAVVGVGIAMGGDPAWGKYAEIVLLWVLTPFVGGGLSYALARALIGAWPEDQTVAGLGALVGAIFVNIEFAVLGTDSGATIAATAAQALPATDLIVAVAMTLVAAALAGSILYWRGQEDPTQVQRRFLLVLGGLVAFSAGGSQVGLAIGPLLPLIEGTAVSTLMLLVGGGIGLLVGSWTAAPRMIKAISQDYSSLGPRRSIAALIPSFAIAQTAVLFGIPVSFNEIIVSAIVGSGYAVGAGGVSRQKMVYTVGAWVLSLAGALVLGYASYWLVEFALL